VGRFPVSALLGAGGFATVFRARDERLDADVAVKVLAENHAFNPDVRERFTLEGRLLRRVADPHVLAVHELGETASGQPFLVLELAEGGDLAARVARARAGGWVPGPDDVRRVADDVSAALASLHAAQVVHRDLAPANLLLVGGPAATGDAVAAGGPLVGPAERLCVADLGLSKDLAAASGLTVSAGTAGFTPPEQRRGGGWVDPRADIWSAGALVVWLLTGRPPGEGGWRDALPSAGWRPDVLAALAVVLGRSLHDDPDGRPADVAAWRDQVRSALALPVPVTERDAPSAAAGDAPRRRARRRALVAGAAVVAVLLAGLGGWLAGRWQQPDDQRTTVADGRVEVRTEQGTASLVLSGPRTQEVDQAVELTLVAEGVQDWVWYAPDGSVYPGSEAIEVTLTSVGSTRVVVVGRDEDGRVFDASLPLRAVQP
jgi:hypothetical protein